MQATITQTGHAQKMGDYQPTAIDNRKKSVDFRLLQTSPNVIAWNESGHIETVTNRELRLLQIAHTWATDF